MQGCQYIFKQNHFVVLGSVALNRYEWHIVNTTYFYVLFRDGDADGDMAR